MKKKNPLNLYVLDLRRKRHEISKEKKVILITLLPSVISQSQTRTHAIKRRRRRKKLLRINSHIYRHEFCLTKAKI